MRGVSQKNHNPHEAAKAMFLGVAMTIGFAALVIAGHFSIEYVLPMLYQSWMIGF